MSGEVILYNAEDGGTQLRLRVEDGTVWLSQAELAELFQTTPQNITQHIRSILRDGELDREATCKDLLHVAHGWTSCRRIEIVSRRALKDAEIASQGSRT